MKNRITKIILGFFVALFAVGSFVPTGFADTPGNNQRPTLTSTAAPCANLTGEKKSVCEFEKQMKSAATIGTAGGFVVMVL